MKVVLLMSKFLKIKAEAVAEGVVMVAVAEDAVMINVAINVIVIEAIEEVDVLKTLEIEVKDVVDALTMIKLEKDAQKIQALTFLVQTDQDALAEEINIKTKLRTKF